MKRKSITTKITLLFLGALLLNGASIIFINLYQTGTMYTNEYNQEIREIANKYKHSHASSNAEPSIAKEFNQLSSYAMYLKLAYEKEVDQAFMSAKNVQLLRQTPNQTLTVNEKGHNYIAALFMIDENELIIMKQIPLLNERSTPILKYSILSVLLLSFPLLVILFIVLRRFTKPILEMNEISEAYAESDFSRQVKVNSSDEIGQLAMSLNEMAARLKAKELARDTFLAGVSHELRTPLTTLKANTSGIIDGIVPPEKVNDFLKSNVEEIDRMIRMVNDLILVSTFEQNLRLHLERVEVTEMIDAVVQSMKWIAQHKQLEFIINVEERGDADFTVLLDRSKMKQVLINLLHNAIQHSPQNGKIWIELKRQDHGTQITIRDEGTGFGEQQLAHMFERFYRDEQSVGLGLGLYISQQIVHAHQGTLSAGNQPSGGACIEIMISENIVGSSQ